MTDALFDPAVVQEPFDYYRTLRTHDPVHEVVPGTFMVTRMDLIQEVVNKTAIFSSAATGFLHKGDWSEPGLRPLLATADGDPPAEMPGVIATADPPDHERQRRVLSKKFSAAAVRTMEPGFRDLVATALGAVGPDGRLDWMASVAEPLPMVMVGRILGLADIDVRKLKRLGFALVHRIGGFVSEAGIDQIDANGLDDMASLIDAYMNARAGVVNDNDGVIAIVAQAVESGDLNDIEAIGILTLLVAAGGESTTSLLGTAARMLAERPEMQDILRAEPSLIPAFVEEALRWDPPFRGHYRIVTEDTELAGTKIAAGSHVVLMWPAANRDERVYDHPDDVRLDRPNPRQHVGFGWGIHLCIGAPLARLEGNVAIAELLASTARIRIDTDAPPPRYHPSLLVRRLESLPLVLA